MTGQLMGPADGADLPAFRQVVLDCLRPRPLAEFYRELLGFAYRAGDEVPPRGEPDPRGDDWLVIRSRDGGAQIAFQQEDDYRPPVWSPDGAPPGAQSQMVHLDLTVDDVAGLVRQRDRATALGASILHDRSEDPDEPLYVFADPAGHPFCIFVAPARR